MSSMQMELQEGVQALQEILRGARLDLLEIMCAMGQPSHDGSGRSWWQSFCLH